MNRPETPHPTDPRQRVDDELLRWQRIYGGESYFYGEEPGPVARRAVRYHRAYQSRGGTALDAGCGEGQDLAFLAERGYTASGIEFVPEAVRKARKLLHARGVSAEVWEQDLRTLDPSRTYDLVIAVNAIQFLGHDAPASLERVLRSVAPGGVVGLSLFAREGSQPEVAGTVWFTTLPELLGRFQGWQPLEAANLWQWNTATNEAQPFVTLIARKTPPRQHGIHLG